MNTSAAARSQFAVAWVALLGLAAAAWIYTVQQTHASMSGTQSFTAFLLVWTVMMIAMMFPSVAPTAIVWMNTVAREASALRRITRMTAFLAGYVTAWAVYGVFAFFMSSPSHRIAAAVLLFAGVYQLTPLKRACLRHCRSPFAALIHYASFKGRTRDFRVGLHHGTYCVGCCWSLMLVLIAAGMMNLFAMVLLSAIIFFEKVWRGGEMLSRFVGFAFVAFGMIYLLR